MPVLYFARDGLDDQLRECATLTFGELRGMFGAYERRYLSQQWLQSQTEARSRSPVRVIVQVCERDGVALGYDKPGFYLLVDLAAAKVDELLKYRESYARRIDDAERWEAAHGRVSRRRRQR